MAWDRSVVRNRILAGGPFGSITIPREWLSTLNIWSLSEVLKRVVIWLLLKKPSLDYEELDNNWLGSSLPLGEKVFE